MFKKIVAPNGEKIRVVSKEYAERVCIGILEITYDVHTLFEYTIYYRKDLSKVAVER